MPIYEFRCASCTRVFEHLAMGAGDQVEVKCPHCGGEELSRVMSTCAAVTDGAKNAPAAQPGVQNRSCGGGNNCTTLTLPGYGD